MKLHLNPFKLLSKTKPLPAKNIAEKKIIEIQVAPEVDFADEADEFVKEYSRFEGDKYSPRIFQDNYSPSDNYRFTRQNTR